MLEKRIPSTNRENIKNYKKKRRKNGINLVEDSKDDEEVNDKDNIQHVIPIREYAKPLKICTMWYNKF
jgi:hypothetical protein